MGIVRSSEFVATDQLLPVPVSGNPGALGRSVQSTVKVNRKLSFAVGTVTGKIVISVANQRVETAHVTGHVAADPCPLGLNGQNVLALAESGLNSGIERVRRSFATSLWPST